MFAVSPGGGVVDEVSHLTGKTRNTAPRRPVCSDSATSVRDTNNSRTGQAIYSIICYCMSA
jgi:hypothetical protein